MFFQDHVNLGWFNAISSDLHLIIDSTEKLNGSVRTPARQISSLIEATTALFTERIGHECFRRSRRLSQVPAANTDSANAQLSVYTHGQRSPMLVYNVEPHVPDRSSDWDVKLFRGRDVVNWMV
jgi:hypothetical protein